MQQALIKLTYRQVIDAGAETAFEKNVMNASYAEYLMKSQVYNPDGKFTTFSQLKANDGRANSLHYKSGFGVAGFIKQLKQTMPGVHDTFGRALAFDTYQFEVTESDITDKSAHKVAIHYITDTLTMFGFAGNCMVLANGVQLKKSTTEAVETFMVLLHSAIAISSYQQAEV